MHSREPRLAFSQSARLRGGCAKLRSFCKSGSHAVRIGVIFSTDCVDLWLEILTSEQICIPQIAIFVKEKCVFCIFTINIYLHIKLRSNSN